MLTVRCPTHSAETMTLHNALEPFTLRSADHINEISLSKKISFYFAAECRSFREMAELNNFPFWGSACFFEMPFQCRWRALLFLLSERKLYSIIAVRFFGLHLGNHAWTCFNHCAWNKLSISSENAGHSYFLSY